MKNSCLNAKQTSEYQSEYSDSKFWAKIQKLIIKAGRKIVYQALLLYYVLKSPDVPYQQKMLIIGALGYLICPTDFIPDVVPVVGYSDDLAVLGTIIKTVSDNITPEIKKQAQDKTDSLFNN